MLQCQDPNQWRKLLIKSSGTNTHGKHVQQRQFSDHSDNEMSQLEQFMQLLKVRGIFSHQHINQIN